MSKQEKMEAALREARDCIADLGSLIGGVDAPMRGDAGYTPVTVRDHTAPPDSAPSGEAVRTVLQNIISACTSRSTGELTMRNIAQDALQALTAPGASVGQNSSDVVACRNSSEASRQHNVEPEPTTLDPDAKCQTCNGHGEVSQFVGSIGSGGEGWQVDPCPDCNSAPQDAKTDAVEIEQADCTLCANVESPGFYTGCMAKDGHGNGWTCDGRGHLARLRTLPSSVSKPVTVEEIAYLAFKQVKYSGVRKDRDDFVRARWQELKDENSTGQCNIDCNCDHVFHGKNHFRKLALALINACTSGVE